MQPENPPLTAQEAAEAAFNYRTERAGIDRAELHLAPEGYVYFIKAGEEGPVKVGWASNPDQRIENLQVGNHLPLEFLGSTEGTKTHERVIHIKLADYHVRGEWYEDGPALRWLMGQVGAASCRHTYKARFERAVDAARIRKMAEDAAEEAARTAA